MSLNIEEAKTRILGVLVDEGRAINDEMIKLLDGDKELFSAVRQTLIMEDLADDKKGVGLVYTGPSGSKVEASTTKAPGGPTEQEPHSRKRIFISYGHDDAGDLAFKLEDNLTGLGHTIWIDKTRIRSGKSWEEQIEKAILEHDVFVALMSPHAIRRPDGVCLDEISMARYSGRKIIPAMVANCRPPLGIFRLDWVDFQQWQSPARYSEALGRLLGAIQAPLDHGVEGVYSKIFSSLQPQSFDIEVARLTKDFTGRKWLTVELDEWLQTGHGRVFFITGDPGTGKSAVMAHLQDKHPEVGACHFCSEKYRGKTLDPHTFVRSLAGQLATQFPNYREALNSIVDSTIESDSGSLLRRLVAEPLMAESPDKPVLLLIDALDEAVLFQGDRNIATLLRDSLDDFPPWVRLVISSRKEPEILDLFSRYAPHEIDAMRAENLQDIAKYLDKKLKEPELTKRVRSAGVSPMKIAEVMAEKGAGNFLYATLAVEAIRSGQIDPARPDSFPRGLVGHYSSLFERVFTEDQQFEDFCPLLDVICAAREPISAEQISSYLGRDRWKLERDLEKVATVFPCRENLYRPFHKSVKDWLVGSAGSSKRFQVNVNKGHARIAERLFAEYLLGKVDHFLLRHLPAHLVGAGLWDELITVLTDLEFIEPKVKAGMIDELQQDYELALGSHPDAELDLVNGKKRHEDLASYRKGLASFADGHTAILTVVGSVTPWTDEAIAADSKRVTENPTPLDRLRIFEQFVKGEGHNFHKAGSLSRFVVQQAFNHSNSGPVAEAAAEILEKEPGTPVLLSSPGSRPVFNPHPACLQTLDGHSGWVRCVDTCPEGMLAVTGSFDNTLRVWDLQTGTCLRVLKGHSDPVNSVSISSDGTRAVSGSEDSTVRVWDLETGSCICALEGHTSGVNSVSLNPGGRFVVSGSDDESVRIWDLELGSCHKVLEGHRGWINSVAQSADGKFCASGSDDHTVRIWDLGTGDCVRILEGHTASVDSISMSPDGKRAISGGEDRVIRLWDLESGDCLRCLDGHAKEVSSVAMTPDGRLAVSGSLDGSLQVWNLETGSCLRALYGHMSGVTSVSLSPDGKHAFSGSWDNTLRIWDVESGICLPNQDWHSSAVNSVSLSGDGKQAVSGSDDHTVRVWDIGTGKCVKVLEGHTSGINTVFISSDAKSAISGGRDSVLRVWDIEEGVCSRTLTGHSSWVMSVSMRRDVGRVISGGCGKTLRVWDIESEKCARILEGHSHEVVSVATDFDAKHVVSGSWDKTLRVWDVERGVCLYSLEGHTAWVNSVALSTESGLAVSGSDDRVIRVWCLETGTCLQTLEGHAGGVIAVALCPESRRVVSAARDNTIRVWDIDSGRCEQAVPVDGLTTIDVCCDASCLVYGTNVGSIGSIQMLNITHV